MKTKLQWICMIFISCMCIVFLSLFYINDRKYTEQNIRLSSQINQLSIELENCKSELLLSQNNMQSDFIGSVSEMQKSINEGISETQGSINKSQQKLNSINKAISENASERGELISDLLVKKNEGIGYYLNEQYKKAYDIFNYIVQVNGTDNESRYYRLSSLFLMNKMDSSRYNEILKECDQLQKLGYNTLKVKEIEEFIYSELGNGLCENQNF